MMQISLTFSATRPTPRIANYVAALMREGDKFDYHQWLKGVRAGEAQANQAEATSTSGELAAALIDKPISTPADQHARPNPALRLMVETIRAPRVLRWPLRRAKSQTPKARPKRWLEKVRCAWAEFQASRARDAVYGYLEAVFAMVQHYKVRRRTKKLLRHAFAFADLPFDKNANPFTAVIRCTSDDNSDNKTISKWARALRYVAWRKDRGTALKRFMKKAGGVNACADRYTKHLGRGAI
jgi:hypothetical protein